MNIRLIFHLFKEVFIICSVNNNRVVNIQYWKTGSIYAYKEIKIMSNVFIYFVFVREMMHHLRVEQIQII